LIQFRDHGQSNAPSISATPFSKPLPQEQRRAEHHREPKKLSLLDFQVHHEDKESQRQQESSPESNDSSDKPTQKKIAKSNHLLIASKTEFRLITPGCEYLLLCGRQLELP
jgi:hypothetical protein